MKPSRRRQGAALQVQRSLGAPGTRGPLQSDLLFSPDKSLLATAPASAAISDFAELPCTAAQLTPGPPPAGCRGAGDVFLGVSGWADLSFYQQQKRQLSPEVRTFLLQVQLCPVPCVLLGQVYGAILSGGLSFQTVACCSWLQEMFSHRTLSVDIS